ncbi:MAG: cyclophane-forming radical SAM/SPASM peptide maturase GrrM/OscB [Bacteroidota bacterium]
MMLTGPLNLLIVQGTPFCNIDCKYCYLPNRLDNHKITIKTFEKILDRIFESNIIRDDFTIVWHAGEPLVMPVSFYEEATALINSKNTTNYRIKQNFQSNGILLNEEWCKFFKKNSKVVNLSLSIDGPQFIHDNQRVNRKGEGTFASVMKSVDLLRKHDIGFGVISVITDFTLDYPKEYYQFFKCLNPKILGMNVEEVEGNNLSSTLYSKNTTSERYTTFIGEIYNMFLSDNRQLPIREFQQIEKFILKSKLYKNGLGQQTTPYRILAVDIDGNFSTLSPELLGMKSAKYGNFVFGNVYENSFEDALETEKFKSVYYDVVYGIVLCKESCQYYNVCGGGTPSNKYSEHKSFAVTETNHCKFKFQVPMDIILERIEKDIALGSFS